MSTERKVTMQPIQYRCTICGAENAMDPPDCPDDPWQCNIIEIEWLPAFVVGDRVRSKPTTLAAHCGDVSGVIERLDGQSLMVRMDQSGRLVPFRPDQLQKKQP